VAVPAPVGPGQVRLPFRLEPPQREAKAVSGSVRGSPEPEPHLVETCLYTNTADESFVLKRRGRLVVGSACSGHGFKFAPLIGERLAALAVKGAA